MKLTEAQKGEFIIALENIRAQMNAKIDRCIEMVKQDAEIEQSESRVFRSITETHRFKGEKPGAIIMPSGVEYPVKKWLDVVRVILKDCNDKPQCHERLLEMCDKVSGRRRVLLGSHPEEMYHPVQVGEEEMFFEAYFDTESLLNILMERVLKPAGYDYRQISIKCRERKKMANVIVDIMSEIDSEFNRT